MKRHGFAWSAGLTLVASLSTFSTGPATAAEAGPKLFYGVELDASYDLVERGKSFSWHSLVWAGTDTHKVLLKSEGEHDRERLDEAELHAYYSRMISQFWDVYGGVRYDFKPVGTTFGAVGIKGLLPYRFEVDLTGFVSHRGRLSARLEVSREILITQRLVADPYVSLDLAAQNEYRRDVAAGLTELETGIKLRYDVTREFAPFVEFRYRRNLGYTSVLVRRDGEAPESVGFRVGIRLRF
ncbi:MAG: copper resistance protein B [Bauldia litoralis]